MKKALAINMAILFAFTITSATFAGEEKLVPPVYMEMKAAPAKYRVKVKTQIGEITSVDEEARTITVKGMTGDIVIAVNDKIFAKVKVGDKVIVKYTEADGQYTAESVEYSTPQIKYVKDDVVSVDTVAKTITVVNKGTGKEEDTIITVDEKTKITKDSLKGTLADIKSGDLVGILYKKAIDKNIAIQVGILPKENEISQAQTKRLPQEELLSPKVFVPQEELLRPKVFVVYTSDLSGPGGKIDEEYARKKIAELKSAPEPPEKQQHAEQCLRMGGIPKSCTGEIFDTSQPLIVGGPDCVVCLPKK